MQTNHIARFQQTSEAHANPAGLARISADEFYGM
jgi:hypothetical protein